MSGAGVFLIDWRLFKRCHFKNRKARRIFCPARWRNGSIVERKARDICRRFNYREIRTPIFETTELFQRGVGETTDIVEKEMYTFTDQGDRSITLRPEGTAGVVRAYVENKLYGEPDMTQAVLHRADVPL